MTFCRCRLDQIRRKVLLLCRKMILFFQIACLFPNRVQLLRTWPCPILGTRHVPNVSILNSMLFDTMNSRFHATELLIKVCLVRFSFVLPLGSRCFNHLSVTFSDFNNLSNFGKLFQPLAVSAMNPLLLVDSVKKSFSHFTWLSI